jgi:hypothetical protein
VKRKSVDKKWVRGRSDLPRTLAIGPDGIGSVGGELVLLLSHAKLDDVSAGVEELAGVKEVDGKHGELYGDVEEEGMSEVEGMELKSCAAYENHEAIKEVERRLMASQMGRPPVAELDGTVDASNEAVRKESIPPVSISFMEESNREREGKSYMQRVEKESPTMTSFHRR